MRKSLGALLAAGFLAGAAVPANAAILPFSGTLSVTIGTLPTVPAFGGGFATVNTSGGGHPITHLALPGGAFATATGGPVPNMFPIVSLRLSFVNGPIVLSGGGCTAGHPFVSCPGGGLNGFGGLSGLSHLPRALVGIFFTTTHGGASTVNTGTNPAFNLFFPLSRLGAGSRRTVMGIGINETVSGAGWTTGAARIINPTATIMNSGGHFPVDIPGLCPPYCASSTVFTTQTGTTLTIAGTRMTDPGSAFGTDSLTLVSPAQTFNTATGAFIPSFATLSIHLIPEPGTLLLLGSGAVVLALYGRLRMQK